jgi:hypothetical protein
MILVAVGGSLFFFHPRKASTSIDGLWVVSGLEGLVECNFPAVVPRITEMCITDGRVAMKAGSSNFEGALTLGENRFHASIDPICFSSNLRRMYLPNGRVGLDGCFQISGDNLILDVDEIGDVIDTRQSRGNSPGTWRMHLQRLSSDCNLVYLIMTHTPAVWPPEWALFSRLALLHISATALLAVPVIALGWNRAGWRCCEVAALVIPFLVWWTFIELELVNKGPGNQAECIFLTPLIVMAALLRVAVGRRSSGWVCFVALLGTLCLAAAGIYVFTPSLPE